LPHLCGSAVRSLGGYRWGGGGTSWQAVGAAGRAAFSRPGGRRLCPYNDSHHACAV